MKMLLVLAAALLAAGCTGQDDAENGVKRLLSDPDSATFSDVRPGAAEGNFCGMVNARNRMGGYVGNTPFFYEKATTISAIVAPPKTDDFRSYWLSIRTKKSNVEDLVEIRQKCDLVARWKPVCGEEYPTPRHALCEAAAGPGDRFYIAMRKEFGD